MDTRSGKVVGAEALLRWMHPEQGLIPPFKFIPLAEEMGLIGEMGDWVIREACKQVQTFAKKGVSLPKVAVNVSALQFTPSFTRRVKSILDELAVDPATLELELTEGVVMGDTNASVQALAELKDLGVSLSIDDFGTGYSSLSYLSRFPLDELKIDRSFVASMLERDDSNAIVKAILALGESLNMKVIAEGVESSAQLEHLRSLHCRQAQGFWFSKPVDAREIRMLLRDSSAQCLESSLQH